MKVIDYFANYLIDILMLTKEFQYYLDNQDELVKEYNHKFLVIKNCEVIGDYNTYEEALLETSKEHELGHFSFRNVLKAIVHIHRHFIQE